jgi:hypothetical protein
MPHFELVAYPALQQATVIPVPMLQGVLPLGVRLAGILPGGATIPGKDEIYARGTTVYVPVPSLP